MEKQLVFVIQVRVDEDMADSVTKAMADWKTRMQGAYAATVQVDEVKVQVE